MGLQSEADVEASAEAFRVEKRSIGDIYHGDRPCLCGWIWCTQDGMLIMWRIFLTNTNGFRLEVNGSEVPAFSECSTRTDMGPACLKMCV